MIKIGIHGASGKMGKMILECLKDSKLARASAVYAVNEIDFPLPCDTIVAANLQELFDNCDVVIDFTIKEGAINLINYARTNPKPLVYLSHSLGI